MTKNSDIDPHLTGETSVQTTPATPDRKDAHQDSYTTTPADDRVGAAQHSKYEAVQAESAREVTAKFDTLATRDVEVMEKTPQAPEYAGVQTVEGMVPDPALLDALTPNAGVGLLTTLNAGMDARERTLDQNPKYTPPSDRGPAHQPEEPADLPEAETPELKAEVQGNG